MRAVITGAEILEGPAEWTGKYIPIVPCLGEEVWIDGKRVLRSAIYHAIDPQKIHNWNVSNDIETKALGPKQPWLATKEQIGEYKDMWDMAYMKPLPYLLWNFVPGQPPPERLFGSVGDQGAVQGMAMSIDAIKAATGRFDASLGAQSNETSGIAIQRRQNQGSMATYVFTDNQTRAVAYTGRILVDLIPKIYDTDRVVRLLGDDLAKKFGQVEPGPDGRPTIQVDPKGLAAYARINFEDPITGKKYNDLTVGKYDIVVDAGPGYMTRRQEAAAGMLQLAMSPAGAQFIPILMPRIAKNADWPEADDIAEDIQKMSQPQQQGPSPDEQLKLAKGKQDLSKGDLDIKGKQLDLAKSAQELQASQSDNDVRTAQIAQQATINVLRQLGVIR
jgi:hypothetical protein